VVRDVLIRSIDVLGDRVALYGVAIINDACQYWSLHVWNWHEGRQKVSPFAHHSQGFHLALQKDICAVGEGRGFTNIRFLVKEKLLALTELSGIELYDIEDLSKAPQLQFSIMLRAVHIFWRPMKVGSGQPTLQIALYA
jgi:hypothetical protein